jgi:hypothetical protein
VQHELHVVLDELLDVVLDVLDELLDHDDDDLHLSSDAAGFDAFPGVEPRRRRPGASPRRSSRRQVGWATSASIR